MSVRIRPATIDDVAQWAALRAALWPDESPSSLADEAARFFSDHRGADATLEAVFVAESEEARALVGFAELSRRRYAEGCTTSPVGFLEGWYVVPERRGEGIGRALVHAAEQWARSLGCTEFASDTQVDNTSSAAAHRALGFDEVEVIRCFRKDLTRQAR